MLNKTAISVPYSYLPEQFADPEPIFDKIRRVVASGDFTLGYTVPNLLIDHSQKVISAHRKEILA